jgi:hypothetical protein
MEVTGILLERYVEDFMASDALMPSQILQTVNFTPERRLLLAVLEDALRILVKGTLPTNGQSPRVPLSEAQDWVDMAGVWPMSFEWVCDGLGINPSSLRGLIAKGTGVLPLRRMEAQVRGRRVPISQGPPRPFKFQRIGMSNGQSRIGSGRHRQGEEW